MMDVISTIKDLDIQLFLFLNGKHNGIFDVVMYWFSHKLFWIPLYVYFLFLAYKQVGKHIWLMLIAVVLLITLSDQLSVHAFKNMFERYRPCHNLLIQDQVHILKGHCGGTFGFVSSHAANVFALATFLSLFFKNNIKYFSLSAFVWASLVAYSRVYGGVHYPADIAAGAVLGMGIGIVVFKLHLLASSKLN